MVSTQIAFSNGEIQLYNVAGVTPAYFRHLRGHTHQVEALSALQRPVIERTRSTQINSLRFCDSESFLAASSDWRVRAALRTALVRGRTQALVRACRCAASPPAALSPFSIPATATR
jgi:hypothetical protein